MTADQLRWMLSETPPDQWRELVERLGGGFFQSPAAAGLAQRGSVPVYAVGVDRTGMRVAAGLGVRWSCRLSWFKRHARLLSLPAVDQGSALTKSDVTASLVAALAHEGVGEVVVDSFDAGTVLEARGALKPGPERTEFLLDIEPARPEPDMLAAMASSHRRKVRAGESSDWSLQTFQGAQASAVLARVQVEAVERRARLSRPTFSISRRENAEDDVLDGGEGTCGVGVFGAVAGGEVLSAASIGWGGNRASYPVGGSTQAGYEKAASFWLHWAIMRRLREMGVTVYNLGGVPAAACEKGHVQHGVFRFKDGFGSRHVACRGGQAVLRPAHLRLHALVRSIGLSSSRGTAIA